MLTHRLTAAVAAALFAVVIASPADARPQIKQDVFQTPITGQDVGQDLSARRKRHRVARVHYTVARGDSGVATHAYCGPVGCPDAGTPKERIRNVRRAGKRHVTDEGVQTSTNLGGFGLIGRARSYLGTNPTGWSSVWCGRFMAMVAPDAASRVKNPNMAKDWLSLPHVGPQVGAIAVFSRKGGGHVGIVTGFDNGYPIIISGNSNGRRVYEGLYPRKPIAYVSAS